MSAKRGTCVHYNGSQHDACKAGVNYVAAFGPREAWGCRAPCIQEYPTHERIDGKMTQVWKPWPRRGHTEMQCDKRVMPTQAEIDADEADLKAHMDKMRVVMNAIRGWRNEKPRGKQTVIDCPTGCGGKLHLSQSSYNGHVHGQCTTKDCVRWME